MGALAMALVFVGSMSAILLVNVADLVLLLKAGQDDPGGDDDTGGGDESASHAAVRMLPSLRAAFR